MTAAATRRLPAFTFRLLEAALVVPLDFDFRAGIFGTFPTTGPIPRVDTNIRSEHTLITAMSASVVQPLTQLRRIRYGVTHLALERDVSKARLDARHRAVSDDVRRVYYALARIDPSLEAAREALALTTELVRIASGQQQQEVTLKADVLAAESRLAKAEYEQLVLRNTRRSLQEQLNALLARDLDVDFQVDALPPPPADDLPGPSEQLALQQRPEVAEAVIRTRQAENALESRRGDAIPDVSLAFNYVALPNLDVVPTHIATAGVLLEWEPFTWGRTRRQRVVAEHAVEQTRAAVTEAEAAVRRDVRAANRKLAEARELLRVMGLVRIAARESARVSLLKYQERAVLFTEALRSEGALAEATAQYEQALGAFWMALADRQRAIGSVH
jgi:outer membrane protein TolC